jgi:hypothetical protein
MESWHPSRCQPYTAGFEVLVSVHNASDSVIRRVVLYMEIIPVRELRQRARRDRSLDFASPIPKSWGEDEPIPIAVYMSRGGDESPDRSIKPGEQANHAMETKFDPDWYLWRITFVDANGQEWCRDVVTNELHKGRLQVVKTPSRIKRRLLKRRNEASAPT